MLCRINEVDDKCSSLEGLAMATGLKESSNVDVFIVAPCSLGKFSFHHDGTVVSRLLRHLYRQ